MLTEAGFHGVVENASDRVGLGQLPEGVQPVD